jgi:hypothetical protein
MKLLSRVITILLCIACVTVFYLDFREWVLPIAAIACVSFFLGMRSDLVMIRDSARAEAEATDSEDPETHI